MNKNKSNCWLYKKLTVFSKQLTHVTPQTHACCFLPPALLKWKIEFIREENAFPKYQTPLNVDTCPPKLVTITSHIHTPKEDGEHWAEFPRDGFWPFTHNIFGHVNWLLQQLSPWLDSYNPNGEAAAFGGPGLLWLHVICGCEAGSATAKFWRWLMEQKWAINSCATAHPQQTFLQKLSCLWIWSVW